MTHKHSFAPTITRMLPRTHGRMNTSIIKLGARQRLQLKCGPMLARLQRISNPLFRFYFRLCFVSISTIFAAFWLPRFSVFLFYAFFPSAIFLAYTFWSHKPIQGTATTGHTVQNNHYQKYYEGESPSINLARTEGTLGLNMITKRTFL